VFPNHPSVDVLSLVNLFEGDKMSSLWTFTLTALAALLIAACGSTSEPSRTATDGGTAAISSAGSQGGSGRPGTSRNGSVAEKLPDVGDTTCLPEQAISDEPPVEGRTIDSNKMGLPNYLTRRPSLAVPFNISGYSDDPDYGFTAEKPIVVGGALVDGSLRQSAFLSRLRDSAGNSLLFERLGSCCPFPEEEGIMGGAMLDQYAVQIQGTAEVAIMYLNLHGNPHSPIEVPQCFTFLGFDTWASRSCVMLPLEDMNYVANYCQNVVELDAELAECFYGNLSMLCANFNLTDECADACWDTTIEVLTERQPEEPSA
jgi:hypothetical protein